jgi:hypothetical protein
MFWPFAEKPHKSRISKNNRICTAFGYCCAKITRQVANCYAERCNGVIPISIALIYLEWFASLNLVNNQMCQTLKLA